MKKLLLLIAGFSIVAAANGIPKGVNHSLILGRFFPNAPQANGGSAIGMLMANVQSKGASPRTHLMVINQTACLLSIIPALTENGAPVVPAPTTDAKLYSVASQIGTWDEVSMFDNLFIMAEGGTSCVAGSVQASAW